MLEREWRFSKWRKNRSFCYNFCGRSLLVIGFPYEEGELSRTVIKDIKSTMRLTDLRVFGGSTALELSYEPGGIIDGYWEYALSPWDLAGGVFNCSRSRSGSFGTRWRKV